ncbi:MAG TPA: hypothetical protein EYM52_13165 [Dehalococcoidia bacterium]|nr:hypothetical protein [SAR202 cluster bacterium]HIM91657.1 hypothetical protein [Dehalococcoidia bacterium]
MAAAEPNALALQAQRRTGGTMFSKRILISAITILLMSLAMDPATAVGADPNTSASNYVETARLIVPDMGPFSVIADVLAVMVLDGLQVYERGPGITF